MRLRRPDKCQRAANVPAATINQTQPLRLDLDQGNVICRCAERIAHIGSCICDLFWTLLETPTRLALIAPMFWALTLTVSFMSGRIYPLVARVLRPSNTRN